MKKLILEHLSVDFRKLLMWPCLAVSAIAEVVSVEQACIFRWVSNSLLHFGCFFTSAGLSRAQLHVDAKQTAQIAWRWSCDSAENRKEGLCSVIICVKLPGFLPAHREWVCHGVQPVQNPLSWEQGFEPWLSLWHPEPWSALQVKLSSCAPLTLLKAESSSPILSALGAAMSEFDLDSRKCSGLSTCHLAFFSVSMREALAGQKSVVSCECWWAL